MNLLLLLFVGLLPFTTHLMATYLKEGEGDHLAAAIYSGSFLAIVDRVRDAQLANPVP